MANHDTWFQRFVGERRAWVRDARGRRVPLVDVAQILALTAIGSERNEHDRERIAEVRRAVFRGVGKAQWVQVALAVAVGIFVWGLLSISVFLGMRGGTARTGWLLTGIIALNALVTVTLALRSVRITRAAHLAASLVNAGRCASCGYDLRNLPAGDDGNRACPECGAAWRLPPENAAATPDAAAAPYRDISPPSERFVRMMRGLGRWIGRVRKSLFRKE